MQDNESREDLSDEEDIAALVMFVTSDPILFKEVLKRAKWRSIMGIETIAYKYMNCTSFVL